MKKALISATLMFFFSLTMLFGSTYAWWSEEIVVRNNEIRMGNLNIKADIADADQTLEEATWYDLETVPSRSIFEVVNQQPGSWDHRFVKITNTGSIPLAYRVITETPTDVPSGLNDFIKFTLELKDSVYNNFCFPVSFGRFETNAFIVLQPGESHVFYVKYDILTTLGDQDGMFGENGSLKFVVKIQAKQIAEAETLGCVFELVDGVLVPATPTVPSPDTCPLDDTTGGCPCF